MVKKNKHEVIYVSVHRLNNVSHCAARGGTSSFAALARASAPPVNFCRLPKLSDHSIAPRIRALLENMTIWNVADQIRESKQTPMDFLESKLQKTELVLSFFGGKQMIKQPISRQVRPRPSEPAENLCRVI